jgi:hypothetical protein
MLGYVLFGDKLVDDAFALGAIRIDLSVNLAYTVTSAPRLGKKGGVIKLSDGTGGAGGVAHSTAMPSGFGVGLSGGMPSRPVNPSDSAFSFL